MDYCLACIGLSKSGDNERDPLLPQHRKHERRQVTTSQEERPVLDRITDALAALNSGKLPSQDQFSQFLRFLLHSELLREDRGKVVPGHGPMSNQGKEVLRDIRAFVEALLQFGMEKNDDDAFQELYFQVIQVGVSPVQVNVDVSSAYSAGLGVDIVNDGVTKVRDQVPSREQLAFDAQTFLSAIRTLGETMISSFAFRLILVDLFSVARALVAHVAADVGRVAMEVQKEAKDVEQKAVMDHDITIAKEEGGDIKCEASLDDLKGKGKEFIGEMKDGVAKEWKDVGEDAADKTRERFLGEIQQIISRIQKDPASRSAVNAILILVGKYADQFASVSEVTSSALAEATEQVSGSLTADSAAPNYPPDPYGSRPKKPVVELTPDPIFEHCKNILQRIAKGHQLDSLLTAVGNVARDLRDFPVGNLTKAVDEKVMGAAADLKTSQGSSKGHKGKKGKEKKKGPDIHSLSESQGGSTLTQHAGENPLQVYFSRVGAYLDSALNEPGWATSKKGKKTLKGLFDDGAELVNVVGESVVEVGEELAQPEDGEEVQPSPSERSKDIKSLATELEAYISAAENDKTTMRLGKAIKNLCSSMSDLMSEGARSGHSLGKSVAGMRGWADWIGWAIPRLVRMLPRGAIPIPSLEIKSGNIEGALNALFVRGLVQGGDPVENRLVPDEVVVREWTEVKIDMADNERPLGNASVGRLPSRPGVQTTSRIHMHMDGVRAKVDGIGYYFKYSGSIIGYEDEGVLSLDVGMGSPHDGFGADVEIELESDYVSFDTGIDTTDIIVEGELEVEEDSDQPANMDVQEAVGSALRVIRAPTSNTQAPAEPLFKIVDVRVALQGLRFKIDDSKHWILNKLFVQPLAGPIIARVIRQAVEDKLRDGLQTLSQGLGTVFESARRKGDIRRAKAREEKMKGQPISEVEDQDVEERLSDILGDWWSALVLTGPAAFRPGRREAINEGVELGSYTEATHKGIMHTIKTGQPQGTDAMVYDKRTRSMERIVLPPQETAETVVAIGGGAQLFPGKGGSERPGDHRITEQVRDKGKHAVDNAINSIQEGSETVGRVGKRWEKSTQLEESNGRTWKSDAFDFQ